MNFVNKICRCLLLTFVISATITLAQDGDPVSRADFKQVASVVGFLGLAANEQTLRHLCAGTLIRPKLVLSSATCVVSNRIQQVQFDAGLARSVVSSAIHPDFNSTFGFGDVAVLELNAPISSIEIPPATFDTDPNGEGPGTFASLVGWNSPGNPNPEPADLPSMVKLDMEILSTQDCAVEHGFVGNDHFCGKERISVVLGSGDCNWDLGAPVFINSGIVSGMRFVPSSCNADEFVVYTRISQFANFIEGIVAILDPLPPTKSPSTSPTFPQPTGSPTLTQPTASPTFPQPTPSPSSEALQENTEGADKGVIFIAGITGASVCFLSVIATTFHISNKRRRNSKARRGGASVYSTKSQMSRKKSGKSAPSSIMQSATVPDSGRWSKVTSKIHIGFSSAKPPSSAETSILPMYNVNPQPHASSFESANSQYSTHSNNQSSAYSQYCGSNTINVSQASEDLYNQPAGNYYGNSRGSSGSSSSTSRKGSAPPSFMANQVEEQQQQQRVSGTSVGSRNAGSGYALNANRVSGNSRKGSGYGTSRMSGNSHKPPPPPISAKKNVGSRVSGNSHTNNESRVSGISRKGSAPPFGTNRTSGSSNASSRKGSAPAFSNLGSSARSSGGSRKGSKFEDFIGPNARTSRSTVGSLAQTDAGFQGSLRRGENKEPANIGRTRMSTLRKAMSTSSAGLSSVWGNIPAFPGGRNRASSSTSGPVEPTQLGGGGSNMLDNRTSSRVTGLQQDNDNNTNTNTNRSSNSSSRSAPMPPPAFHRAGPADSDAATNRPRVPGANQNRFSKFLNNVRISKII